MITTYAELDKWRKEAIARHGDAAAPVAHLGFKWHEGAIMEYTGPDMIAGMWGGRFNIVVKHRFPLMIPLVVGEMKIIDTTTMSMKAWGSKRIAPGVWAVDPSLNQIGFIHGYIVLVDVPEVDGVPPWGLS